MSLNKVILIGNLGRDPEVRYMPSGEMLATLSVATSETWKDKAGNRQEQTEWHRVAMFGRLAEIAAEYLKKGNQVYVEGRIRTRKYTDKDGVERHFTEIVANRMKMLGKPATQNAKGTNPAGKSPSRAAVEYAMRSGKALAQSASDSHSLSRYVEFDDIPF